MPNVTPNNQIQGAVQPATPTPYDSSSLTAAQTSDGSHPSSNADTSKVVRLPPKDSKGEWRVASNKGKAVQVERSLCPDPMPDSPPATLQVSCEAIATIGAMETNEVIESSSSHGPNSSNLLNGSTSVGPVLKDPDP
ncbi:hypothetical protein F0562_034146 [Nyssa sinensis]|uniref:Uncharacterized protein n=1 Tax=Nyssa sinensis TaxID=561372 RepID=A0A5J5AHP8_9ASTE|nr:hypothetical protein F0562_034146 [Nyssa sinensis]